MPVGPQRILAGLLVASVCGACASAPSPPNAAGGASAAATPCALTLPEVTEPWQQIDAPTLTFCLPPSWRQVNARTWRGQGTMTLNVGDPQRVPFRIGRVTAAGSEPITPSFPSRRFTETIGGRAAEILVFGGTRGYTVYVSWTAPQVQMTGQAASSGLVDLHLSIARTVRFKE